MVDRKHIIDAIEAYCRAETEKNKAAWLDLFAGNIVHEDPVGVRTNTGLSMLGEFWDSFQDYDLELWTTEPVIVCGNEAIALMKCRMGPADARQESGTIVDHFVFDDDGKITSVRAFYNY